MPIYWFDGRALSSRDVLPRQPPYQESLMRQLIKRLLVARIRTDSERMQFCIAAGFGIWAIEASYFVDSVLELAHFEHKWSIADHNTPSLELKNMPAIWQGAINMANYQRALSRLEETAKSQGITVPTGTAISTISASDEREFVYKPGTTGATEPNASECGATTSRTKTMDPSTPAASTKPTTSSRNTNANANGREHEVERRQKDGNRGSSTGMWSQAPHYQLAKTANDTSAGVSFVPKMTQGSHAKCIAPAQAGHPSKMTEIASQCEKRVQLQMLQETASYKAPDASGRVRKTQYAQHECITPAQAGQLPKMAKDAFPYLCHQKPSRTRC